MRPSPLTAAIRRLARDDTTLAAPPGSTCGPSETRTGVEPCAVDPALCEGCNASHALTSCATAPWNAADDPSG